MALPIVWSPAALDDLNAIALYIERQSPQNAADVVVRIFATVERLAEFPQSGPVVPEKQDSLIRQTHVSGFRIIYQVLPESLEVVAIVRGTRDFNLALEDRFR